MDHTTRTDNLLMYSNKGGINVFNELISIIILISSYFIGKKLPEIGRISYLYIN
jgi:hypothetical protein